MGFHFSIKEMEDLVMLFSTSRLDFEYLQELERDSQLLFLHIIEQYYGRFEELGLSLRPSYFWENERFLKSTRLPYEDGYTMYVEAYTYLNEKKVCVAEGEADDLGYFTSILYISKRRRYKYRIYVNTEFEDLHERLDIILRSAKELKLRYF